MALLVPITVRKIIFMGLCVLGGGMYVSNDTPGVMIHLPMTVRDAVLVSAARVDTDRAPPFHGGAGPGRALEQAADEL